MLNRAYYIQRVGDFVYQNDVSILGELVSNHPFDLEPLQRLSWIEAIKILKQQIQSFDDAHIMFEYSIPRIGKRIDNVLLYSGIVFLLEFKVGEHAYPHYAVDQVVDYALDLKNFHAQSHNKKIVPILISTKAPAINNIINIAPDGVFKPLFCNGTNIRRTIELVVSSFKESEFDPQIWMHSEYRPTPTIIEAAKALYRDHRVSDISRNDADAINLAETTKAVNQIISKSKANNRKSICFITGVPGAGKTLAGLNIANEHRSSSEGSHAVFLSGNQPLVDVLKEALASDKAEREKISKNIALREVRSFIQIIHHFRDEAVSLPLPPVDHVAIFDEAQRAWDESSLTKFMHQKKGVPEFRKSEPEFLIEYMDRHQDWAVIVCLIGGGQEINTGEAGLLEWFRSLEKNFQHWDVYLSRNLSDSEYVADSSLELLVKNINHLYINELHLSVSLRSFRSENVSALIKNILDVKINDAQAILTKVLPTYPIAMTRDLEVAKLWVLSHARGTERYGIIASSGAKRLRKFGIWVQSKADAANWFLKNKEDVRSSYYLEETATEFDIQGLEVDWAVVCWDGDFRFHNNSFMHFKFNGSRWMNIRNTDDQKYQKNAYRVLLTRARQGFVIFIPRGDDGDMTRPHEYYDGTYNYLKEIGIPEIK